jgi:hypothetical protein
MGGGGMPAGMGDIMQDPELMAAMQNPKVKVRAAASLSSS